ncbi:MAG: hypothetical protein Kow0010_10630 [Dehalococcoidia bacterium]
MRKIFAVAALVSVAGAVILGGAFAWRTSDSARGAALVGSNGFSISYSPNCTATFNEPFLDVDVGDAEAEGPIAPIPCATLIGPNGTTTEVGRGAGKNDGDFDLVVVGGDVKIRAVHYADRECQPAHFNGFVRLLDPGRPIPPGGEGGKFAAYVGVAPGAPASCQGQLVYYRVTIVAENPAAITPVEPTPRE